MESAINSVIMQRVLIWSVYEWRGQKPANSWRRVGSKMEATRDRIIFIILFVTFKTVIPHQLSQIVRLSFFGNLTIRLSFRESGMDLEVQTSLMIGNKYYEITSLLYLSNSGAT